MRVAYPRFRDGDMLSTLQQIVASLPEPINETVCTAHDKLPLTHHYATFRRLMKGKGPVNVIYLSKELGMNRCTVNNILQRYFRPAGLVKTLTVSRGHGAKSLHERVGA